MNDKIYFCAPADKKAAIAVSQAGCTTELTDEQIRENLVARRQRIVDVMRTMPKSNKVRKALARDVDALNEELKLLKTKRSMRDLHHYILGVVREKMSMYEWKITVDEAVRRKNAADANN